MFGFVTAEGDVVKAAAVFCAVSDFGGGRQRLSEYPSRAR